MTRERKRPRARKNPNPGSELARVYGCICAVMDNNHGRFPPWGADGWWITQGCPVHAPMPEDDDE